jgi:hypothetical protein
VERAAALALFHGEVALAVLMLQRRIRLQSQNGFPAETQTASTYASTPSALISLVAVCIAGYFNYGAGDSGGYAFSNTSGINSNNINGGGGNGGGGGDGGGGAGGTHVDKTKRDMWTSMCDHVISQLEENNTSQKDADADPKRSDSRNYLASCLRFLLCTLRVGGAGKCDASTADVSVFSSIIDDERLSLEDRISFVATFLDDSSALQWLQKVRETHTARGNLGGLIVTGLTSDGLDLLQQYLDRTDDLQTVALLAARNVIDDPSASGGSLFTAKPSPATGGGGGGGSSGGGGGSGVGGSGGGSSGGLSASTSSSLRPVAATHEAHEKREWRWLWLYRNLLNKMQIFMGRAALDVEIGKRCRAVLAGRSDSKMATTMPSLGGTAMAPRGGGMPPGRGSGAGPGGVTVPGGAIDRKTSAARLLYQMPPHSDAPHVFLRCNYCSSSLPSDPLQQQQASFLRKQRPLINFCANCKKPLPRCYVCLLYMGLVNPTLEFNRALAQRRKLAAGAGTGGSALAATTAGTAAAAAAAAALNGEGDDAAQSHNMLAFGRWYFFCQHCKHGGHAACIESWFEENGATNSSAAGGKKICGVNGCLCQCRSLR